MKHKSTKNCDDTEMHNELIWALASWPTASSGSAGTSFKYAIHTSACYILKGLVLFHFLNTILYPN